MAARCRAHRSHRDQGSEPLARKWGDGAVFNPHIEAFSSHGNGTLSVLKENSPTEFVLKEIVKIKARAETCTLDDKTDHVLVITCEGGRQGGGPQMLDCDHRHVGPEDVARFALAVSVTRSDPPMAQRSQDLLTKFSAAVGFLGDKSTELITCLLELTGRPLAEHGDWRWTTQIWSAARCGATVKRSPISTTDTRGWCARSVGTRRAICHKLRT